jgi:type IV pilus assembly protein PilW
VELKQNVRAAMDMMSRDIRMAGYNPRGKAVYPFEGIPYSTAQLRIKADLNGIFSLLGPNEDIIYVYDSANYRITRELVAGGGAQPFAENITAFTFSFLDGSDSVTTIPANIRKIRLTITGRTFAPIEDGSYPTYTLSADVYARNLAF